jgi:hypothetical protein
MTDTVFVFVCKHTELRGLSSPDGDGLPKQHEPWRPLATTGLCPSDLRRYTLDPVLACRDLRTHGAHLGRLSAKIHIFPMGRPKREARA